jgi:hypothetical protein
VGHPGRWAEIRHADLGLLVHIGNAWREEKIDHAKRKLTFAALRRGLWGVIGGESSDNQISRRVSVARLDRIGGGN